ncbi:hypothetical protein FRC04_007510 [Tulasnella sp. 424]|nr:hypothetical protein FRC04_007510 [Tulasnella sp. 424]KAG8975191.1 hypothetical protein FRC05_006359 [Tulasnella sp. 425]
MLPNANLSLRARSIWTHISNSTNTTTLTPKTFDANVPHTGAAAALRKTARAKILAIDTLHGTRISPSDFVAPIKPAPPILTSPLDPKISSRAQPLVDNFSRMHDYLRISLTERCNLRCFYCMPEEGIDLSPSEDILNDDEVVRLATLFVRHGVRKIRLTGGEPTIRKDIVDIVRRLNQLHPLGLRSIGMTSNGLALHRKLPELVNNGLTHLNLSLDTLDPARFERITRRRGHEAVMKSLDTALALLAPASTGVGLRRVKLNVVVVKGVNDGEVFDFLELTRNKDLSVRFIEFMPFSGNGWDKDRLVPSAVLLDRITSRHPGTTKAKDELNDTARSYTIPRFKGSFGFISTFGAPLGKVCLFDGAEISLRDRLRAGASDDELSALVGFAVGQKKAKHEEMEEIDTVTNRPMILIAPTARGSLNLQSKRAMPPIFMQSHLFGYDMQASSRSYASLPTQSFRTFTTSTHSNSSQKLTHVDATGNPSMVNVSDKAITKRSATAVGRIHLTADAFALLYPSESAPGTSTLLTKEQRKAASKGPVLTTAQLAGILAAKQTSSIIPLCHPIGLKHVSVTFAPSEIHPLAIECKATAECQGQTGVEMEALMAVNGALLCVWDMLKAVAGKEMRIEDVKVVEKSGGRSGDWVRPSEDK